MKIPHNLAVNRDTGIALLNAGWGDGTLTVRYPIYGDLELIKYNIQTGELTYCCDQEAFDRAAPPAQHRPLDLLPSWDDFGACLTASGAAMYKNERDVRDKLRDHVSGGVGARHLTLGFDTNLLYDAVGHRRLSLWFEEEEDIYKPDYVVARGVLNEIEKKYFDRNGDEKKLNSDDRKAVVSKLFPHHHRDSRFSLGGLGGDEKGRVRWILRKLRLKPGARLAAAGRADLRFLDRHLGARIIEPEDPGDRDMRGDPIIAKTYGAYQSRADHTTLLVLHKDGALGTKLEAEGAEHLHVVSPSNLHNGIPCKELDERIVKTLLYELALRFGTIEIPELDAWLFGDFGAKDDTLGYERERLRVRFEEESTFRRVKQAIEIAERNLTTHGTPVEL